MVGETESVAFKVGNSVAIALLYKGLAFREFAKVMKPLSSISFDLLHSKSKYWAAPSRRSKKLLVALPLLDMSAFAISSDHSSEFF